MLWMQWPMSSCSWWLKDVYEIRVYVMTPLTAVITYSIIIFCCHLTHFVTKTTRLPTSYENLSEVGRWGEKKMSWVMNSGWANLNSLALLSWFRSMMITALIDHPISSSSVCVFLYFAQSFILIYTCTCMMKTFFLPQISGAQDPAHCSRQDWRDASGEDQQDREGGGTGVRHLWVEQLR